MKINYDQLTSHLQPLHPIYFLHGDEHLLVQEAQQRLRQCAQQQGYEERVTFTLTPSFDWQAFWQQASNLSLFSQRQLIELIIPNGKPGDKGAKQLVAYAESPPTDTLLIIISSKLAPASQRSRWYKALTDAGVVIPVWPIDRQRLPQWLNQRLQQAELTTDPAGISLLADCVEGNLLAASQEIEKLRLLYGPGHLSAEQMTQAISNHSRFDVFKLTDSVLLGEKGRVSRILQELKAEGIEPTIVLWAISREFRLLARIAHGLAQGQAFAQLCRQYAVWQNRQSLVKQAVANKSAGYFLRLLHKAHHIDAMIKGVRPGDPWLALLSLVIR